MKRTAQPRPLQQLPNSRPNRNTPSVIRPPPRHIKPPPRAKVRPPPRRIPPQLRKGHARHRQNCCHTQTTHENISTIRPPPRHVKPSAHLNPSQAHRRQAWNIYSQHESNRAPASHGCLPTPPRGRPPRTNHRPMSARSYFSSRKPPRGAPREPPRGKPSLGTKSAALNGHIRGQDVSVSARSLNLTELQ